MDAQQLKECAEFAKHAVIFGGDTTLAFFRKQPDVTDKLADSGFDPVTQADKECESKIRDQIRNHYPDHDILGEEFEGSSNKEFTWIIDPIDGTRSFISGLVHWGVLLGLRWRGVPVLGAMYQPFTGELFTGGRTGEISLPTTLTTRDSEAQKCHTRDSVQLKDATLMTTDPRLFQSHEDKKRYGRLEESVRLVRYGADCYQYAMLACGHIDVVCENALHAWDIEPLIPIIKAAGGFVSDWEGNTPLGSDKVLACGSANLHEEALSQLSLG